MLICFIYHICCIHYISYIHITHYIYSLYIYIWSILWTKRFWSYQLLSKRKHAHTLNYNLCFMFYMFLMFHRGFAVRLGAGGCFIDVCTEILTYVTYVQKHVYPWCVIFASCPFMFIGLWGSAVCRRLWDEEQKQDGRKGQTENVGSWDDMSHRPTWGPQPPRISIGLQM